MGYEQGHIPPDADSWHPDRDLEITVDVPKAKMPVIDIGEIPDADTDLTQLKEVFVPPPENNTKMAIEHTANRAELLRRKLVLIREDYQRLSKMSGVRPESLRAKQFEIDKAERELERLESEFPDLKNAA